MRHSGLANAVKMMEMLTKPYWANGLPQYHCTLEAHLPSKVVLRASIIQNTGFIERESITYRFFQDGTYMSQAHA